MHYKSTQTNKVLTFVLVFDSVNCINLNFFFGKFWNNETIFKLMFISSASLHAGEQLVNVCGVRLGLDYMQFTISTWVTTSQTWKIWLLRNYENEGFLGTVEWLISCEVCKYAASSKLFRKICWVQHGNAP